MSASIHQLVYLSFANFEIGNKEIVSKILEKSRVNNKELDVTGMLFYNNGTFIQLIEGQKENIEKLYKKISKDPRHEHLQIFWEGQANQRSFPNWSMGLKNIEELNTETKESFKNIINCDHPDTCSFDAQAGYEFFMKLKEKF